MKRLERLTGKKQATPIKPLPDHPLARALARPNQWMTQWALVYATVVALELTGRAYIWCTEGKDGLELYFLPSHWMRPQHTEQTLYDHFLVTPYNRGTSFTLPGEEVLVISVTDVSDPYIGAFSSLNAQGRATLADEHIQEAQVAAFR